MWIFSVLLLVGCANNASQQKQYSLNVSGPNVMKVKVAHQGVCGHNGYLNEPCTSVTICAISDPTQCQTIDDILVDTGSAGLRIFKSLITVTLPSIAADSGVYAECVTFGSGSDWGDIRLANVVLGGESAVEVPIQVIDSSFGTRPSVCTGSDISPSGAGFNGILGVGIMAADCGIECADIVNNHQYYACTGASCVSASISITSQVTNPVSLLPVNNNGVLLEMPSTPANGMVATGALVLGINTQSNNTISDITIFPLDAYGDLTTIYNGVTISGSFLDSGSNSIDLTDASVSQNASHFFTPSSAVKKTATIISNDAVVTKNVSFTIENANDTFNSSFFVAPFLAAYGGSAGFPMFDWGFPFFYGRKIATAIEGISAEYPNGYFAF